MQEWEGLEAAFHCCINKPKWAQADIIKYIHNTFYASSLIDKLGYF